MTSVGEFVLALPWALLLLPLPIFARMLLPALQSVTRRALLVPRVKRYQTLGAGPQRARWLSWPLAIAMGIWCLLVIAAARPQWLGEPQDTKVTGRDLMLCIDISGSMRETDLLDGNQPLSRMAVVRQVGSEFISRRSGDRVGLIMFGSQAYVQTPLTFDHATVQHFLGEAQVGLAGRSTAIGDAIGLGIKRLRDRPEQSRVLILLTDGANSAGVVQPLEAADVAAESGIRIHTIGVGSDPRGIVSQLGLRVQPSELDETTLQEIAARTGGQYFRARNVTELQQIYAVIDELEPVESDEEIYRPLRELFAWPLGAALLLSAMVALVYSVRRR